MLAIPLTGWMKSSLPARLFLSVDPLLGPGAKSGAGGCKVFLQEPKLLVCRDFSRSLQSPARCRGVTAGMCLVGSRGTGGWLSAGDGQSDPLVL